MRTRFLAIVALAVALTGCGSGGNAGATGPAGSSGPGATTGATAPAGNATLTFCEAAAKLEVPMDRAEIQAGLENGTPAGLEDSVAVVREWMERQQAGDDPYQDPDFLDEYDIAFDEIREHCGIG